MAAVCTSWQEEEQGAAALILLGYTSWFHFFLDHNLKTNLMNPSCDFSPNCFQSFLLYDLLLMTVTAQDDVRSAWKDGSSWVETNGNHPFEQQLEVLPQPSALRVSGSKLFCHNTNTTQHKCIYTVLQQLFKQGHNFPVWLKQECFHYLLDICNK